VAIFGLGAVGLSVSHFNSSAYYFNGSNNFGTLYFICNCGIYVSRLLKEPGLQELPGLLVLI
jgi:hypothetical protein